MTTPPPSHRMETAAAPGLPGPDPGGSTRRRRAAAIGGGALLVVVIVAVVAVVTAGSGRSDGARLAGGHRSASPSPTPSGNPAVKSHQLSASPKASPSATEPPAHQPPAQISDKVDWSPFAHTYGTATAAASGSRSASNGVTQVQASQSFGDYNGAGMVSVTADAQYFASAGQARSRYDSACGNGSGKKSGSMKVADLGDRACSYVSDVSDGSSGSAILYVQVLLGNVVLQVAPMAFHNGAWSDPDLANLRSASVQCAGNTVAKL